MVRFKFIAHRILKLHKSIDKNSPQFNTLTSKIHSKYPQEFTYSIF
jgi:hypothetical protein